jgi:hypothetical protein
MSDRVVLNCSTGAGSQVAFTDSEAQAKASDEAAEVLTQSATATRVSNAATIRTQAANALAANRTFIALTAPTNAQVVAQTKALSRQMNALIRLALGNLDGTD